MVRKQPVSVDAATGLKLSCSSSRQVELRRVVGDYTERDDEPGVKGQRDWVRHNRIHVHRKPAARQHGGRARRRIHDRRPDERLLRQRRARHVETGVSPSHEHNTRTMRTRRQADTQWPNTAAPTSRHNQPHHSTLDAHPRASDPVTRTVAGTSERCRERCSSITRRRRPDNEETLPSATAACWTDTTASTPSRPEQ